jgi:hypothetical protein
MSQVPLALVFLGIWSVLDQWPFRWLAWLWLIVVSLPFLIIVGLGLAVIASSTWLFRLSAAQRNVAPSSNSNSIQSPPGE